MFVWCKLPDDDLKKIETFWSLSGLCVKVYLLVLVHLLILSIKLFINLWQPTGYVTHQQV